MSKQCKTKVTMIHRHFKDNGGYSYETSRLKWVKKLEDNIR